MAEKWDGPLIQWRDGRRGGLEARARRAEAEREAARAVAFSHGLKLDARVLELERELDEKTSSLSWHLTAPLRELNRLRRDASERRRERAVDD